LAKPAVAALLQGFNDGSNGGQQAARLGQNEQAEEAGHGQSLLSGDAPAAAFIDEQGIGLKFQREGDGFGFAGIERGGQDGHGDGLRGEDFKPSR
jgi:hypothetical protein